MSTAESIRTTIEKAPSGTFFHASQLPGPPRAVESELSRLARRGLVQRARKGLYWKGRTSRFGSTRPDPVAVAFEVAGDRGVGYSGVSASYALGLSMQVPPRPELVVVGPPPSGVKGVTFHSRNNLHRRHLRPAEVALLEVLRLWPYGVEMSEEEFATRIQALAREKAIDLDRVAEAAEHESRTVRERLGALLLSSPASRRQRSTAVASG
ncbi:MAG: hypothetical protein ACRDFX_04530 [Chloroflexota bacterium]